MPAGSHPSFELVSRGFRALAQRRHAYYLDLLQSGRWQRYYSELEFAARLRDVMAVTRFWNELSDDVPERAELNVRPAA
jgi:hypothetical protein